MRWPWQPREYVAVLAALHQTEMALARRDAEARKQRAAAAQALNKQHEVADEITKRQKERK